MKYNFQVENVVIDVPMQKCVMNCNLTVTQGKYSFDPVSKILHWDVGRIDPQKLPNIRGVVSFGLFPFELHILTFIFIADKLTKWGCIT